MSAILKSILKEESQSIKLHYSSGDADRTKEAVTVYGMSGKLTFRLTKLPNEITLKTDENAENKYYEVRYSYATPEIKAKLERNPEIKEKVYEILFSYRPTLDSSNERVVKVREDFQNEMTELFDHVSTFLKARVIAFNHDLNEAYDQASEEMKTQIDKLLADIE